MAVMQASLSLEEAARRRPRLRRPFDPERDGHPVIVTGHPRDWTSAAEAAERAGGSVLAYHDRFWQARRPMHRWRPVVPLAWALPRNAAWLFAGQPKKRYFSGVAEGLNRCLWQEPLPERRQVGRRLPEILSDSGAELEEIYQNLFDPQSRDTLASIVRSRQEGDVGYLTIAPYREYAHPVVRARPGDVVIDAGAFIGETTRMFAWQMRGRGTIVSLEPDPANFRKLARRRVPGLKTLNVGSWNEDRKLGFASGGRAGSHIAADGGATIEVRRIDRIARDLRLPAVDLIKMDVEGAEEASLAGAEATLAARPKLQISIYHRQADLYRLPQQLMRALPDYRWFMGHHCPWGSETDLYGIPEEKIR